MRVLIVGLGSIAKKHINALKEIDKEIEIFALRRNGSKPISKDLKVNEVYRKEEIPDKLDFIIISNPTSLHFDTIIKLKELNTPFFIEKPIVNKIEHISILQEQLDEKMTYVACNLRYHPAIVFIKTMLKEGDIKIDQVNIYCGSYLPQWRPDEDYRKSYSANKKMGGGVHLDLIHELDYCYWLFGSPLDIVSKYKSTSHLNIDSTDQAIYILEYNDFLANISLNYFRKDTKRTLEIVTKKGTINADLINCKVMQDGITIFEDANYNIHNTYYEQIKYYLSCLNKNVKPMNSITEATEVLKICLNNGRT